MRIFGDPNVLIFLNDITRHVRGTGGINSYSYYLVILLPFRATSRGVGIEKLELGWFGLV
jgi:hypothetical protein